MNEKITVEEIIYDRKTGNTYAHYANDYELTIEQVTAHLETLGYIEADQDNGGENRYQVDYDVVTIETYAIIIRMDGE